STGAACADPGPGTGLTAKAVSWAVALDVVPGGVARPMVWLEGGSAFVHADRIIHAPAAHASATTGSSPATQRRRPGRLAPFNRDVPSPLMTNPSTPRRTPIAPQSKAAPAKCRAAGFETIAAARSATSANPQTPNWLHAKLANFRCASSPAA